jgi:hypothetical protein
MKHAIRISVLMFGLVGTYVAAAVPQVSAPDGGPLPLCPPDSPKTPKCPDGGNFPPLAELNH